MRIKQRGLIGASVIIVVGLAAGFKFVGAGHSATPPSGVMTPRYLRVEAPKDGGKISLEFRIANRGGQDLVIHDISTTCGCTVASVEPRIVKSGGEGIIKVVGTPPPSGERLVEITAATNSEPVAQLVAQLSMVGIQPVPHIAHSSGPVRFGILRAKSGPVSEAILIDTREVEGSPPWIDRFQVSEKGLVVTGGLTEETLFSSGVVARTYRYSAELRKVPSSGEFRYQIDFLGKTTADPRPILSLSVQGTVRLPVYAIPTVVYGKWRHGTDPPHYTIAFRAEDPSQPLNIVPSPQPDGPIDVDVLTDLNNRSAFRISPRPGASLPIEESIIFRTTNPEVPEISVRVIITAE